MSSRKWRKKTVHGSSKPPFLVHFAFFCFFRGNSISWSECFGALLPNNPARRPPAPKSQPSSAPRFEVPPLPKRKAPHPSAPQGGRFLDPEPWPPGPELFPEHRNFGLLAAQPLPKILDRASSHLAFPASLSGRSPIIPPSVCSREKQTGE